MRKRRIVSYILLTASYLWFSYLVFLSRNDVEVRIDNVEDLLMIDKCLIQFQQAIRY